MPLHKSSRAPRLDPTMISAPLGDFRHTMHIGRGGDVFGDTSFLSTHGPSPASSDLGAPGTLPAVDSEIPLDHGEITTDGLETAQNNDLQHSESVSSFTLDLDLDLGPSILGDVLGVMDGLGLDSTNEEDVFGPNNNMAVVDVKKGSVMTEDRHLSLSTHNEFNNTEPVGMDGNPIVDKGDSRITDGNGIKPKGLRPKVRFSDKREEIIRQASEEEEGQGFQFQDEEELESPSQTVSQSENGTYLGGAGEAEINNHKADMPPSPASSQSSDYEGINPLDCRRVESHSETDSEEEMGDCGRGYTFEDEFDDEIGL